LVIPNFSCEKAGVNEVNNKRIDAILGDRLDFFIVLIVSNNRMRFVGIMKTSGSSKLRK